MSQYDIIISGKLLESVSPEQAVERLAKLFKMPVEQAARLVDGKAHRIKKGVDEATARKFKAVLTQAGLHTLVRASEPANTGGADQTQNAAPGTAAEPAKPAGTTTSIDLAPPGTPVLREEERSEVTAPDLDLSGLTLDELTPWPGTGEPDPAPVEPPDFGLAPPGADIETLPDTREKLNPDTSKLDIDEPGATLGSPKKEDPPAPDTSHIKLEKHNPFL
ncbi:MAG TPA: hypothetical protein DIW43_00585 [Spongiibacteraceae bacterium]|nr:hypothetical protein [Spongiibacteraceae bacterium]HCS25916.1 hypothetical protein [Spongiibacteraceae bacterium]